MNPMKMRWLRREHGGGPCGARLRAGQTVVTVEPHWAREEFRGGFGGGSFGVRRPLRYLVWKLGLEESKVAELAEILDKLKTERAQAAVDDRRSLTAFAEAVGSEAFDGAKASSGASLRVKSAENLQGAVVEALSRIHAILSQEQRLKLATLIRTGALIL